MNLIFYLQKNVKGFFKLLYHCRCVWPDMYGQVIQNNKFAISLQYLKKELSGEVDFFARR